HDPVSLAGVHIGGQVGLELGDGIGVLAAHKDVGENIIVVHLRGVDLLDPVQTVLGVVGAGDVDIVVVVQDGQRTVDALGLADLDRRCVTQGRVLEHRLAVGIGGHFKNVKAVVLAIGAPVVLSRLDGDVHLVQPGADQGGIGCLGSDHTAAAVEATGEGTVLRGDIGGVGGQIGRGLPVG